MISVKKTLMNRIRSSRSEIAEFTQKLIRFKSLPGNEGDIQRFIAKQFSDMGLEIDMWEPNPDELKKHPAFHFSKTSMDYKGRPNIVAKLSGSGHGRSLILNGHVDVVSADPLENWIHNPWAGTIRNGRIFGRGASDMKGGLAAMIMAIKFIRETGISLKGDVIMESVVDEEQGLGNGTLACILKNYRADAAIVAEPTENNVDTIQRGSIWFRIQVEGKAAHHGFRDEGVSAIEKAMLVHNALLEFEKLRKKIHHLLLKDHLTLNVGIMNSGSWSGTVPDKAILDGVFGYLPNEDLDTLKSEFLKWIATSTSDDRWLKSRPPKVEIYYINEAAEIEISHPIVATVKKSFSDLGLVRKFNISALPSGCDMRLLNNVAGIPTIIFGPGSIRCAHSVNECVSIAEIIRCTEVIALTIVNWCSKSPE